MPKRTLFIIDAYNLIYRMFYAIPEMHTRTGEQVNAIFWVAKFLKWLADENPDASLLVATDVGQSFRSEIYTEYKAQRDRMPDNLRSQIEGVFDIFRSAGIEILAHEWYEADDIIGSIAHQHENNGYQIVIISSDKDLCQFVQDGHVHIYDAMKRKFLKEKDVVEKFGIPAHQVRDYLAIVGDASDNIPGISGFGPKKAVDLLGKYETLEWIYDHLDEISAKMQEVLLNQKENAFLSQQLASIKTDLDIIPIPETSFAPGVQSPEYIELLQRYEFRSLLPSNHSEDHRKAEDIKSTHVTTIAELDRIQQKISERDTQHVIISTDAFGKVVLGINGEVFVIDSTKVDMSDFLGVLLSSDVELVGYNLKSDLKRLHSIQKPLESGVSEEQGRLF
jgi:DNA polymerase-1